MNLLKSLEKMKYPVYVFTSKYFHFEQVYCVGHHFCNGLFVQLDNFDVFSGKKCNSLARSAICKKKQGHFARTLTRWNMGGASVQHFPGGRTAARQLTHTFFASFMCFKFNQRVYQNHFLKIICV